MKAKFYFHRFTHFNFDFMWVTYLSDLVTYLSGTYPMADMKVKWMTKVIKN